MDLSQYIEDHGIRQKKYLGYEHLKSWAQLPESERVRLGLKLTAYIAEELNEVNRELSSGPHRYKGFKADSPVDVVKLRDECSDVLIYYIGLVAVLGFSGEEMEQAIQSKLNYNSERSDHVRK